MPPKVMILGLDGATFRFIRPMIAAGRLPALASLVERGASGELKSIYPPHTSAAWPTFFTGQLPGHHGAFNFYELELNQYSRRGAPTLSTARQGHTIFDVASRAGMKVASIHVPMTFPTWKVNGVMFSGYPAPAGSPACAYPRELAARWGDLTGITWTLDPDKRLAWSRRHIARQTEICEEALTEYQPDLFMTVFMESDWAHHYLMRYSDSRSPAYTEADGARYGDYINRMYEALDEALVRLLKHAGPDTTVIVVSDHGGTVSAPNAFHLNAWLAEQGLFTPAGGSKTQTGYNLARPVIKRLKRFPIRELREQSWMRRIAPLVDGTADLAKRTGLNRIMERAYEVVDSGTKFDPARTKAYRFQIVTQAEGIVINLAGRQPEGIVQPGDEYEALRDEIVAGLKALRTPEGEPLMLDVYKREDVFPGPYMEGVPDIVTRLDPMYRVGTNPTAPLFTKLTADDVRGPLSGWHDDYGIMIVTGPGVANQTQVPNAELSNMAPTVLRALGMTAPDWMEGVVQPGVFDSEAEFVPAAVGGGGDEWQADDYEVTESEEQSIKERLQNLGYL
ncbi:MAG TPA: alkaline phosphatase family protein [Ktedonobacterales bacterium]